MLQLMASTVLLVYFPFCTNRNLEILSRKNRLFSTSTPQEFVRNYCKLKTHIKGNSNDISANENTFPLSFKKNNKQFEKGKERIQFSFSFFLFLACACPLGKFLFLFFHACKKPFNELVHPLQGEQYTLFFL